MLKEYLEELQISPVDQLHMTNQMTSFYSLAIALDQCTSAEQVLKYLKAELDTRNRPSYVSRIYGRYRKMLPKTDLETLTQWRHNERK